MDPVDDVESQRLLELLDQAIRDARRSRRDVERSLGLGQGYLGSLFRGRIELKVWHVYRLARELKLDPLTFFFEVSPPESPRWVLKALGLDPDKVLETKAPEKDEKREEPETKDGEKKKQPLMTAEEIEAIVLRAIREELERRGLGEPGDPREPKGS
jgi:hypothetical protein